MLVEHLADDSPIPKPELLYDFVTGRVNFRTNVKRRTSRVRRDKFDLQRHAGGVVTALQRRPRPFPGGDVPGSWPKTPTLVVVPLVGQDEDCARDTMSLAEG